MSHAALWSAWAVFTVGQNVVRVFSTRAKNSASRLYCGWTTCLDALLFTASFAGLGAGVLEGMRGHVARFVTVAVVCCVLCGAGSLVGQSFALRFERGNGAVRP